MADLNEDPLESLVNQETIRLTRGIAKWLEENCRPKERPVHGYSRGRILDFVLNERLIDGRTLSIWYARNPHSTAEYPNPSDLLTVNINPVHNGQFGYMFIDKGLTGQPKSFQLRTMTQKLILLQPTGLEEGVPNGHEPPEPQRISYYACILYDVTNKLRDTRNRFA